MSAPDQSNPGMSPDKQALANKRTLDIINKRGLHVRASAKFVQTVETFDAVVTVSKDDISVGGRSIMGLMLLTASMGSQIEVSATGPDALAVLDALEALLADRFGEAD